MLQTRKCLDEIVDLFQSRSGVGGLELIDRVVDLYFLTADQQSAEDLDTFGDVMTRIAFAGNALTRAKLSERMSRAKRAPRDLMKRLACDEIIVARPVLQYSPCLLDGDLVPILRGFDEDHQIATAHRAKLSVPVTDILMKCGSEQVLLTMVSNIGARFSPESQMRLTEMARNHPEIQIAIDMRHDLAPGALTRLKRLAEAEFWQGLAESVLMTETKIVAEKPRKPILPAPDKKPPDPDTLNEPEKSPPADGAVNPADEKALVDAARASEIEETLKHFSKITQLNETMLEHCLFEAHIPALMVLCKAHGLAPGTFTALLQLKESHTRQPSNDTAGLMRRYDGMTQETAQRVIKFSDQRRKLDEAELSLLDEDETSGTSDVAASN